MLSAVERLQVALIARSLLDPQAGPPVLPGGGFDQSARRPRHTSRLANSGPRDTTEQGRRQSCTGAAQVVNVISAKDSRENPSSQCGRLIVFLCKKNSPNV